MNKQDVDIYDQKFPEKDYKKQNFAFSAQELRELSEYSPLQKMGVIAERMMNQIINESFLKRVGVPASPDCGVLYDIPAGQAIVYSPKIFCMSCKTRKAEFQYEGKYYCKSCVDILKTQLDQTKKEEKLKKGK